MIQERQNKPAVDHADRSKADKRTLAFVTALHNNKLITKEQFQWCQRHATIPVRKVAQGLVKEKVITCWQAKALLNGKRVLYGRYLLLDKLAEGGNGSIYKARHTLFGREVVVKILAPDLLKSEDGLARFLREAEMVASLNHPNIVTAYDTDCVDGLHFLVLEYVQGRDLRHWLAEYGCLPIRWACECILQGARGMEHAHQQGMVHRDLKPGNLIVIAPDTNTRPHVKVLDLGCARLTTEASQDRLTRSNQLFGTPDYIAPEQAESTRNADIRSDVFSLGCTLFKLLTGELPFSGKSVLQKMVARATHDPTPARRIRPEIPAQLEAVLTKALARDPDDRYQTPGELAAALEPFGMPEAAAPAVAGDDARPRPTEAAPYPAEETKSLSHIEDTYREPTESEVERQPEPPQVPDRPPLEPPAATSQPTAHTSNFDVLAKVVPAIAALACGAILGTLLIRGLLL